MGSAIGVLADHREGVARILVEALGMEPPVAGRLLEDGRLEAEEFFIHRGDIAVLPNPRNMIRSRLVDRTYAARVFNDGFLQEAGFDQDFFEDFYEETVLRAANADSSEGKRGGVIDSLLEVLRPYGLIEVVRTGRVAMARGAGSSDRAGESLVTDAMSDEVSNFSV